MKSALLGMTLTAVAPLAAAQIANFDSDAPDQPPAGWKIDRGGRWKDGDNYYVARANALENNVSLYYTRNGTRNTLKYVDAPVKTGKWHELIVEFAGPRIQVILDGYQYIDFQDTHITGGGAAGVWTKADSVTEFDDFQVETAK